MEKPDRVLLYFSISYFNVSPCCIILTFAICFGLTILSTDKDESPDLGSVAKLITVVQFIGIVCLLAYQSRLSFPLALELQTVCSVDLDITFIFIA